MDVKIDFEGADQTVDTTPAETTPANQEETTHLNGGGVDDVTGNDGNKPVDNTTPTTEEPKEDTTEDSASDLEPGTQLEFDGATYTVAENGDIVDKDGNVFKEAKDVKAWLDENNVGDEQEDDSELSLSSIQNAVGIEVTDEQGNPVEFTNDAEGIKGYVNAVINQSANAIQQGAINKLFADNPMLQQFIDYVQLTGTPRGFGDIPDRSGIKLDQNNEAQLEAVILMAGREFNNQSINENYIKYLKSTGALYDEAQKQLGALVQQDKAYRQQLEQQAALQRQQEEQELQAYWQGVNNVIQTRKIGEYQLPESFVKTVNGQKLTYTPNDFFDYLYRPTVVDEQGNQLTGYQRDLNSLSDEEALNKELLDAWLMFTGGTYKDLVDMATKEKEVRKLIVKSKENRTAKTIKINKPKASKAKAEDIIFY